MRSTWQGSISFGLINIPIVMYSASHERSIDLDMLRRKDNCKIHFKRVCGDTNEEVPYEDIVRGYEIEKGKYVILEKEDLEKAQAEQTHTMDIVSFVKEEEVDSVYFDKPYYVEPVKGGEKAYELLRQALKKSNRVAVAKLVMRTKEQIGLLKAENIPVAGGKELIVFNRMRYPDEIVPDKEIKVGKKISLEKKEMDLALRLVEQLTEPFKPEELKDHYREKLEKFIKNREKQKDIKVPAPKEATDVKQLMAELERSLDHVSTSKKRKAPSATVH